MHSRMEGSEEGRDRAHLRPELGSENVTWGNSLPPAGASVPSPAILGGPKVPPAARATLGPAGGVPARRYSAKPPGAGPAARGRRGLRGRRAGSARRRGGTVPARPRPPPPAGRRGPGPEVT